MMSRIDTFLNLLLHDATLLQKQLLLPIETNSMTTQVVVAFILPLMIMIIIIIFVTTTTTTTSRNSKSKKYGCTTPILYNTIQGRSYPILGHAITFLLYPPWDLLTLWHQKKDCSRPLPCNCNSSSSSSSSSQQQQQQQEPILCFPLMGHTMFSIASPIYCKYILQNKIINVQKDIYNTMLPFLSILGTGIVSSEGQHWLQQRLKMSTPLRHDILHIIPYQTLVSIQRLFIILDTAATTTTTNANMNTTNNNHNHNNNNNQVPIGSLLRHLTLQVISSSFLSLSHIESDTTFAKLYLPIVDECNQRVWHPYRTYLFILPSFWIYLYNVYCLNRYVSTLIRKRWILRCQEHHATNSRGHDTTTTTTTTNRRMDILDKILQVYESGSSSSSNHDTASFNGSSISTLNRTNNTILLPESIVKQVRDEMKTFMLAGHETSAALMTWTIYELLLSSQQQQNSNSNNNNDSIKSPTLLEKVIAEANHVFDPNIDWRTATEDDIPPNNINNNNNSESSAVSSSSSSTLQHLTLIEACLKETLRKYSVVPIVARRVVQDLYLPKHDNNNSNTISTTTTSKNPSSSSSEEGRGSQQLMEQQQQYFLPKGSTVLINIQAVHLDPNIWPQPMKYDPYRFLENTTVEQLPVPTTKDNENVDKTKTNGGSSSQPPLSSTTTLSLKEIEPYTFLPFIAGPRNCLGQHLALLETKMVIALLFQRYDFTLPDDMQMIVPNNTDIWKNATSWRDPTIHDPRHRYMVPIIPKKEIMLRVSRKQQGIINEVYQS